MGHILKRLLLLSLLLLACISNSWAAYIQDTDCEIAFLFTEGTGNTIYDSSPNNNSATCSGTASWSAMSGTNAPSYAPYMQNFATDYDTIATDFTGSESTFTIVVWINPTNYNYYTAALAKTNSNIPDPFDFYLGQGGGNATFYWGDGSNYGLVGTAASVSTGQWTHLAFVCNGGIATNSLIYYNGNSQTINNTRDNTSFADHSQTGYIGTRGDQGTHLIGSLTEVAYFKRVLSSIEINDIMDNGLSGGGAPPAAGKINRQVIIF
jgi:hypothetical protein